MYTPPPSSPLLRSKNTLVSQKPTDSFQLPPQMRSADETHVPVQILQIFETSHCMMRCIMHTCIALKKKDPPSPTNPVEVVVLHMLPTNDVQVM